jgi:hypothetical protein
MKNADFVRVPKTGVTYVNLFCPPRCLFCPHARPNREFTFRVFNTRPVSQPGIHCYNSGIDLFVKPTSDS